MKCNCVTGSTNWVTPIRCRKTPAYSPESNGMAEWFDDYNRVHPPTGLDMKLPLEYQEVNKLTEDLSV